MILSPTTVLLRGIKTRSYVLTKSYQCCRISLTLTLRLVECAGQSLLKTGEEFTKVLFEDENGLWTNILTNNSTFFETSASAMFMMSLSRKISLIFYLKTFCFNEQIEKIRKIKCVKQMKSNFLHVQGIQVTLKGLYA